MDIRFRFVIAAAFFLFLVAGPAAGSPFVSIGEGQTHSWATALAGGAGGTLQTATGLTDQEQNFYTWPTVSIR